MRPGAQNGLAARTLHNTAQSCGVIHHPEHLSASQRGAFNKKDGRKGRTFTASNRLLTRLNGISAECPARATIALDQMTVARCSATRHHPVLLPTVKSRCRRAATQYSCQRSRVTAWHGKSKSSGRTLHNCRGCRCSARRVEASAGSPRYYGCPRIQPRRIQPFCL